MRCAEYDAIADERIRPRRVAGASASLTVVLRASVGLMGRPPLRSSQFDRRVVGLKPRLAIPRRFPRFARLLPFFGGPALDVALEHAIFEALLFVNRFGDVVK